MPSSSRGLGYQVFILEIAGSNPAGGTTMKRKKLYILIVCLIIVLAGGYFINKKYLNNDVNQTSLSPLASLSPSISISSAQELTATPASEDIPTAYLIKNFPFQSQAPLGNWDALHEESCEEASLILVKYWKDGKSLSADQMENEIQKMIAWENDNGFPQDLTVAQLGQVAQKYYEMSKPRVEYDITISDIKKAIAQNHPVIIPAAGRLLGNPYFTAPGPIYHMIVAIGYQGNTIIVQDVGTRRGNNYNYNQKILLNAIHDWSGNKENIATGKKAILIFEE
ncbi:MAG: hypothetical protein HW405_652 [Candidatus Berkelbacteria bacterium]|nr:hypothetical protein [Candidatus Berkelbacteria bacterium]